MGEIDVRKMLSKIGMEQFMYWIAYSRLTGPISDDRQDMLMASLRMDMHNRGSKTRRHLDDFMPKWVMKSRNKSGEDWQYNKRMAYLIAHAMSGKQ